MPTQESVPSGVEEITQPEASSKRVTRSSAKERASASAQPNAPTSKRSHSDIDDPEKVLKKQKTSPTQALSRSTSNGSSSHSEQATVNVIVSESDSADSVQRPTQPLLIPHSPTHPYEEHKLDNPYGRSYASQRYWPNMHVLQKDGTLGAMQKPIYYAADGVTSRTGKFKDDAEQAARANAERAKRAAKRDEKHAKDDEKLQVKAAALMTRAAREAEESESTPVLDAVKAADTESQDSPREGTPLKRGFGRGRGGRGRGRGGRGGRGGGPGRGRGRRAGDDSPEPPHRQRNLTPDTEDAVKKLKARQAELKRFFHLVGSQQAELLDLMAGRDVQKLLKKPKAHKTVPEHDALVEELEARMEDAKQAARDEYNFKVQYEKDIFEKRKAVQEQQFQQHCRQVRAEHLQGAQGDISLLKRAHAHATDDTYTDDGDDLDFFPRYNEFPEADARIRGYSANINDEKPFKEALESYYVQDVVDEEITGPMRKAVEEENRKIKEQILAKMSRDHKGMKELSNECIRQLEAIKGYLIPKPLEPSEFSAFTLSALADVADWVAENHPQKTYQYVPLAPADTFPREALEFGPLPGLSRRLAPALHPVQPPLLPQQPMSSTARANRRRRRSPPPASPLRPQLNLQTSMNGSAHPHQPTSVPTTPAPLLPTPVVSSGPGQAIAPAPPRPLPTTAPAPTPVFRHSPYSIPPSSRAVPTPSPRSVAPSQQYVFQPPQQQQVHQPMPGGWGSSGPPPPPSAGSPGPGTMTSFPVQSSYSAGPSPGGFGAFPGNQASPPGAPAVGGHHQGKIPVQFINNTPASTKEKAARKAERRRAEEAERERRGREIEREERERKGSGQSEASGQRMLLPKP